MIALKCIMVSKKSMASKMNLTKEEIKEMALKINALYVKSPEDYAYLKGWIHSLLYSENSSGDFGIVAREEFWGFPDKN